MLLKRCSTASCRVSHVSGRRAVSIPPRAFAFPSTPYAQSSSPPLLPPTLGTLAPIDLGSRPLSYRTITTDPVFRPVVRSDQQDAPGPPKLLSRHLTSNPLHALTAWLREQAVRLDLAFAAAMDRNPFAHWAAAAATAALTYLGLHPLSVLRLGIPAAAADWLEARLGGEWAVGLVGLVVLAVGLLAAMWQLRSWVASHLALMRFEAVVRAAAAVVASAKEEEEAVRATATTTTPRTSSPSPSLAAAAAAAAAADRSTSPSTSTLSSTSSPSPAAAAAAAAAPSGPFLSLVPEPLRGLFAGNWKSTDRTWLLLIMAGRLSALYTAASCLLYGTATAAAVTAAVAYAVVCFGASLLPLALPHIRHLLAASPKVAGQGGSAALAAATVLADAAFLMALAPLAPAPARAAAAATLAACSGLAAVAAAASPRLAASQAAPGDVATFHVVVRLPTSGTLIDTTRGHQPLTAVVGDDVAPGVDGGATADGAAEASVAAAGDPQARFRPLKALLAAAVLPGMYLDERRTVEVAVDGDDGGGGMPFRNPGLVWWQPVDDLQRKLGSEERALRAGDVFWYPVGSLVSELGASGRLSTAAPSSMSGASSSAAAALPGADSWGPVEVIAASEGWVQLDANAGLRGGQAEVEVQLVGLGKKKQ
ncbi:hypothetical protein VOLCADRAFT_99595 [Volvox carteri f. nagariensis]|uniref:Uncharacterized protein n=1 Tax=Volvox carteri f. nagariensis TaxID=3068 RepID=D8UI52_VOLCA|nr:uncharacterized protein VOLCADRAFT_99595 [Volvox carteri f. nagariensis]EFJ40633.1 hypothetical protein VOLCADRAFT_99595 [Volvox carteri f. nagariensis]|eukprot:XP_002958340.1 hypothetical protein VOLCADRAFT_99595 [Volvox carteri f. nagariensis]